MLCQVFENNPHCNFLHSLDCQPSAFLWQNHVWDCFNWYCLISAKNCLGCVVLSNLLLRGGARWGLGGATAPSLGNSSPPIRESPSAVREVPDLPKSSLIGWKGKSREVLFGDGLLLFATLPPFRFPVEKAPSSMKLQHSRLQPPIFGQPSKTSAIINLWKRQNWLQWDTPKVA